MKPSSVVAKDKVITEWTQVVTDSKFNAQITRSKKQYNSGTFEQRISLPKSVENLMGGLILDIPLIGTKAYLSQNLDIENLCSDQELIQFLERTLEQYRANKKGRNLDGCLNGTDAINPGSDL